MKYHQMTKNYIFREFECGLSVKDTAALCFKNVRTVKSWDDGKEIPPECKRLMRLHKKLELSNYEEWKGFTMKGDKLQLPTGQRVSPQQILAGIALLEIGSPDEISTSTYLVRTASALSKLKTG